MAASIRNTCTRDTYIGSIYAMGTQIGCASIKDACIRGIYTKNIFVEDIELRVFVGLGVILISQKINNCYL